MKFAPQKHRIMANNYIKDKKKIPAALITGSALGIGRSIAIEFSKKGYLVIIADINEIEGEKLAEHIKRNNGNALYRKVDLSKKDSIKNLFSYLSKNITGLSVLVNNAIPSKNNKNKYSYSNWDNEMNVSLKAQLELSLFVKDILSKNNGAIVNVSSVLGFTIGPQSVCYHLAKSAIIQLTRYLAKHFAEDGIRVNCICPGLVNREDSGPHFNESEYNKKLAKLTVPLQRAGNSSEIAKAVIMLCSSDASYITGQTIVVDGGLSINEVFSSVTNVMNNIEYIQNL